MPNFYRILRHDWPLHFVLLLTNWLPDNVVFLRFRGWLASFFIGRCGKNLRLGRDITFYNPSQIMIGNHVYIAKGCWFSAGYQIEIQDEVLFGPYVVVASSNHTKSDGSFRYGKPVGNKISIGKGAWIASQCTITAGCIIGSASLIGANTVVTHSVPDNVLFAGNPGRTIKHLNQ